MTAIVAIGAIPLAFESKEFYFAALIGFFCGWFLDVFTKAGVSAFYPMSMARLALLKGELLEAESNLALERAKLETAKANRNYTEQKDALEIQKAKITIGEQRVSVETQIAQLEAQITNLNRQIIALAAVRAPFAGTIKKIIWEGQINDEITVVISVDLSDSDSCAK